MGGKKTKKGQSHARDGELSAWLVKILALLPFPVLGRRLQNRLKSDVLVSSKALSRVRSISINYLIELFSLGGQLELPAPSFGLILWSLLMQLKGAGARLPGVLFVHSVLILSRSLHARLLPHPQLGRSPGMAFPRIDNDCPTNKGFLKRYEETTNLEQSEYLQASGTVAVDGEVALATFPLHLTKDQFLQVKTRC